MASSELKTPDPSSMAMASEGRHRVGALLVSVSLSATFPEDLEEAREYLIELEMRTDVSPASELLVAGAVRAGIHDYFAAQVMRHVVLRDRDTDRTDDREFTGWAALSKAVAEFPGDGAT